MKTKDFLLIKTPPPFTPKSTTNMHALAHALIPFVPPALLTLIYIFFACILSLDILDRTYLMLIWALAHLLLPIWALTLNKHNPFLEFTLGTIAALMLQLIAYNLVANTASFCLKYDPDWWLILPMYILPALLLATSTLFALGWAITRNLPPKP